MPEIFQLAEIESSRAGKLGMEVGSVRERIIVALLMMFFDRSVINTDTPITEPETDVYLFDEPVSIKTITGKMIGGVKLIWTVDASKAKEFALNYKPSCDMIFVHINWGERGGLYLISKEIQKEVLERLGRDNYIKLPKEGTNPRGVEITNVAMRELASHRKTKCIDIDWRRSEIEPDIYAKWLEAWQE